MVTRRACTRATISALAGAMVAGAALLLSSRRGEVRIAADGFESLTLFDAFVECPKNLPARRAAERAELQGVLLSERYPYDPRDGVLAVRRFREAQSCYVASGVDDESVRRTAHLASTLAARIEADYASSRLALESALAAEKWSVAHAELFKLLRLTQHRRGHPFAEQLRKVAGKVTLRANDLP